MERALMWKLCIDDDQAKRTIVDLVRNEYTIGRAEDNSVRLTERNISRHHAKLAQKGDHWVLTDLGSYNGCLINGRRIESEKALEYGQVVVLGDYQLRVLDAAADSVRTPDAQATVPARRVSQPPVPEDRLIVLTGPTPLQEHPLRGASLRVGRGEECDVRLDDTSVSRIHVTLHQLTDGVYQIKDEGSSNGLRVNGREVEDAVLAPDDHIELGDVELVFVPRGRNFDPRAYRPRTWQGAQGALARLRHNPKLAVSAGAGALLFAVGLYALTSGGNQVVEPTKSAAARALDDAEGQMKAGQIEVAHETLKTIGRESNLRQSERFRQVERSWADDQFERAKRASSATEERHILERIAEATGVDAARRKRASDLLAVLAESDLVPTDLPEAVPDAGPVAAQPTTPPKPKRGIRAAPPKPARTVLDLDEAAPRAAQRQPISELRDPPEPKGPPEPEHAQPDPE
jgi:pSer/pThr/pTyr-binding forkhead associated (FHA) protein